jgi:hypothetical protein
MTFSPRLLRQSAGMDRSVVPLIEAEDSPNKACSTVVTPTDGPPQLIELASCVAQPRLQNLRTLALEFCISSIRWSSAGH